MVNVSDRTLAAYIGNLGTSVSVDNGIVDRTSLKGMTPQAIQQLRGAIEAASAAGLSHIVVTAGKGGGHKSHSEGTEWDIKGVNSDGSRWTNAQRVAVAKGAQSAGANRFGLYEMDKGLGQGTLHFGYAGKGRPAGFWGANGLTNGDKSRAYKDSDEVAFYKDSTGQAMSRAEARKAIEDLGFTGASAVMQFQRAAGIPADGKIGPVTRGAIRDAMAQDTRFANRPATPDAAPTPPADIPTVPGLTNAGARAIFADKNVLTPTVSASDLVRQYQSTQGIPAPSAVVERSPLPAGQAPLSASDILASIGVSATPAQPAAADTISSAVAPSYDPISSIATPAPASAGNIIAQAAGTSYDPTSSISSVSPASIITQATQPASTLGIGSDPDRNFPNSNDPAQVASALEASNLASRVNADYRSLRNGYGADNGTGARLPAPRGVETMGANSIFDDGTVQSAAAVPTFSSRTSEYDPLTSVQSTTPVAPATPISVEQFDVRWAAVPQPYSDMSPAQFDDRWDAALGKPSAAQTISNANFNDRFNAGIPASQPVQSSAASLSSRYGDALGTIRSATGAGQGSLTAPAMSSSSFDSRFDGSTAPASSFDRSYDSALGPIVAPSSQRQAPSAVDTIRTASIAAPVATSTPELDTYNPNSQSMAATTIRTATDPRQATFPGKEKDDYVAPTADVVFTQKADPYGVKLPANASPEAQPLTAPLPRERPLQKEWSQPGPLKREGGFANSGVKNKTALAVIGAALGGMAGSPALGAALGKTLGSFADRSHPTYAVPSLQGMTNIGSGLQGIMQIMSGSAAPNSYSEARNNPDGYGVTWSTDSNGVAQQHVSTPSGGGYTVKNIGPSLSPIQVTTYDSQPDQRRDSTSGGSGNPTGTGGLY
jgi:hypothetical protein